MKLNYDDPLSTSAFKFNLRRYTKAAAREASHELAQLDEEPSQAARALEAARVEAATRMDEQLQSLGLQAGSSTCSHFRSS